MTTKKFEWIDDVIVSIMVEDGPDGHCDGHEIITDFIMALKNGTEDEWVTNYEKRVEEKQKQYDEWIKSQ